MARGISINVGLNEVDPAGYFGWNVKLRGCENDARAMSRIAERQGYAPTLILTQEATSARVFRELALAARSLADGDTLLLTFSGHGSQIDDVTGDEPDLKDEVWLLFDRFILDDEMYNALAQFRVGVRILVVLDSCHSGTAVHFLKLLAEAPSLSERLGLRAELGDHLMPPEIAAEVFDRHRTLFEGLQWANMRGEGFRPSASVILLAASQDNQTAKDGEPNSRFTEKLLEVWDGGEFRGDHASFFQRIVSLMPPIQTPQMTLLGPADRAFLKQRPFTVN